MKTKNIKIISSMMIFLFCWSCMSNSETNESDTDKIIDVPYKPCYCEEDAIRGTVEELGTLQLKTNLFMDSVPKQISEQMAIKNSEGYEISWIIYYSETEEAWIEIHPNPYTKGGGMRSYGRICNFPRLTEEWTIPKNGCLVEIEGIKFTPDCWGGVANAVYYDCILKSIKRK